MEHYAGIDVSLELSSVCIVDAKGKIVRETKVPSDPAALVGFFRPRPKASGDGHRTHGQESAASPPMSS